MRVTRSQVSGSGPLASHLKPQNCLKIAKSRPKTLQIQQNAVKNEDTISKKLNSSPDVVEVQKCLSSPTKSASKLVLKPHIEQAFSHIPIPLDLKLPPSFIDYHTPEFVKGINHVLKIDPSLYPAIAFGNFEAFARNAADPKTKDLDLINHYWYSLISSVISQQVSGSAAKAIKSRFRGLFSNFPTPQETLKVPQDKLKAVGLLSMKLKYVVHISEVYSDPQSNLASLLFYKNSSTDELIAELTKLKGIGEWSANMFAIFTLKELDIFAYDDLGVARGVARYLQVRPQVLAETKAGVHAVEELKTRLKRKSKFHADKSKRDWVPLHDEYVKFLALKFEPYRTAFMLVMWRLSSTNIDALESKEK